MPAGRPPFVGDSPLVVLKQHLLDAAPDVAGLRSDTPRAIARLVEGLLAKSPAARPPSASAVLVAVRAPNEMPQTLASTETKPSGEPSGERPEASIEPLAAREAFIEGRRYWDRAVQGGPAARHRLELARVYLERAATLAPDNATVLAALADS